MKPIQNSFQNLSRLSWGIVTSGLALALMILLQGTFIASATAPDRVDVPLQICDEQGQQASGANYLICMPSGTWNNKLVVYAHGYIAPTEPILDLTTAADVTAIRDLAHFQGYAFAATSYSKNGVAVLEGIDDLLDLVDIFKTEQGMPEQVYLLGFSQGGLVATLALERHPDIFSGGLALCGPYGDFRQQSDYFAHTRVLFDYFFPGVMPGSAITIPTTLMDDWTGYYSDTIKPALMDSANADSLDQLIATAGVAFNADAENGKVDALENVLWYNVFATNDGIASLGGQPFDNMDTVYSGSNNDAQLNDEVARFTADSAALAELERYQTNGQLRRPLVTMHTRQDPIVPYEQASLYQAKVEQAGRVDYHQHVASNQYGHCQFSQLEFFGTLPRLEVLASSAPPFEIQTFFPIMMKSQ